MDFYNLEATKAFLISLKALIIDEDRLLILRITGDLAWELPGGLLEMDENLANGLKREVREETGLEITVGRLVNAWDNYVSNFNVKDGRKLDVRVILLAFECSSQTTAVSLSHEHDGYLWVNLHELPTINFAANTAAVIQIYLAQIRT